MNYENSLAPDAVVRWVDEDGVAHRPWRFILRDQSLRTTACRVFGGTFTPSDIPVTCLGCLGSNDDG